MRTLAVDYGTRRTGIAVSDALGISARGVATLEGLGDRAVVERVATLATELEAEAVVVGLPLRADGTEGDAARRVLRFVERLRGAVAIPVHTLNEWLTSYEAEARMRDAGLRARDRKRRVDEAAAVVILEEFLAAQARGHEESRRDG
jgi:putative Holliday junction resolvase